MVDVKIEGKERETDDLKAKLEEKGKLLAHLWVTYIDIFTRAFQLLISTLQDPILKCCIVLSKKENSIKLLDLFVFRHSSGDSWSGRYTQFCVSETDAVSVTGKWSIPWTGSSLGQVGKERVKNE